MAKDKAKKKEKSVLDQVKKIEKFKKAQLLASALEEIKDKAKDVLILKEETSILLEEVGISKADAKKVIDYVNSLVKLTEQDKKAVRERVKEFKEDKEEKITKKLEKHPYPQILAYNADNDSLASYTANDVSNTVTLGDSSYQVNL